MTEYSFYALRHFSDRRQTGEEVAIPNIALLNVSWLDGVGHNFGVRDHISDSFPSDFPVIDFEVKRNIVGWESTVHELLMLLFAEL